MEGFGIAWMHWNLASILGFACLFGLIAVMNIWHVVSPGYARKGFLPMATTRGERVFLSLLMFFAVGLLWIALLPGVSILWSLPISGALIFIVTRWG